MNKESNRPSKIKFAWKFITFCINTYYFWIVLTRQEQEQECYYKRFYFMTIISFLLTQLYFFIMIIEEVGQQIKGKRIEESNLQKKYFIFILPISLIVCVGYWQLMLQDPKRLFKNNKEDGFSGYMIYIHGGNTVLLMSQLTWLNFSPQLMQHSHFHPLFRLLLFSFFFFFYCYIQYLHLLNYQHHVYPFMAQYTWNQFIAFYSQLITLTILFDYITIKLLTKKPQKVKS